MMLSTCWALQDIIKEFITVHSDSNLENDRLTNMEWTTVRVIKDFLKKLSMSIKACKSKDSTLDLILLCTDYILSLFEKLKDEYKEDPTFSTIFNSR